MTHTIRFQCWMLAGVSIVIVGLGAACSSTDETVWASAPKDGGAGDAKPDVANAGGAAGGAGSAGAAGGLAQGGQAGQGGVAGGGEAGAGLDASTGGQGGTVVDSGALDVNFAYDAPDVQKEACATVMVKAEPLPLDLYFMLDTSGSMSGSNILALHQGVTNFCTDPTAAGIGVTGNRFAIGGFNETCNPNDYATPAVPWAVLPNPKFVQWVNGLNADGYTPSVPALTGAVSACKARVAANPTHKCVVVFVTDGNPEGNCPPTSSASKTPLGQIAADSCANGIPVFTIGFPNLPSLGQGIIDYVAQQGCTGKAFIIQSGSMGGQFTQQLKNIQQAALGCEYLMPTIEGGLINPSAVDLKYTPGGGVQQSLPRVNDASQCNNGDGWYYDDNNSPTKLLLCPDTCTKVKADAAGKVDIDLGCLGS